MWLRTDLMIGGIVGSVRRRNVAAAALALVLSATACGTLPEEPPVTLRAGYDSLDGSLRVWPARGQFIADESMRNRVAAVVAQWRTPADDRVYLPSSGILWLGELDGAPLALVAADVPGDRGSWLLQLTGDGTDFRVTRAAEYPDPGYLVYSDVLPVQVSTGRRYLTSARVAALVGPDEEEIKLSDGLSAPVEVPACAAVPITARLRATESQPAGRLTDRVVDLGTAMVDPRYPLIRDESGSGIKALAGVDTCALAAETGPFGSIPRTVRGRDHAASMPTSWPMERITARSLGEISLPGAGAGRIDLLTWRTDSGVLTSVIFRPEQGTPVAATADRPEPLQVHLLSLGDQLLTVLTWRAGTNTALSLPGTVKRLVDRPGLVVVANPAKRQTVTLTSGDKVHTRTIGGD